MRRQRVPFLYIRYGRIRAAKHFVRDDVSHGITLTSLAQRVFLCDSWQTSVETTRVSRQRECGMRDKCKTLSNLLSLRNRLSDRIVIRSI